MRGHIWFTEVNVHGAIVIYGDIGIRQYYYYTERQACKLYKEECEKADELVARRERR